MSNRFLPLYNQYRVEMKSLDFLLKAKHSYPKDILSLNKENWSVHTENVTVTNEANSLYVDHTMSKRDSFYIAYLEENTNFSTGPMYDCQLEPDQKYLVNFNGLTDEHVKIDLFVISYKNQKKVNIQSVHLNRSQTIETEKDADSFRIAIRFIGKGSSVIQQVQFVELNKILETVSPSVQPKKEPINLEEYKWQHVINSNEMFNEKWFVPKAKNTAKVTFSSNCIHADFDFEENEYQYISYREQNINFSQKSMKFPIEVNSEYRYEATVKGNKQDTAGVHFFLIFYAEKGTKEQVEVLNLNETKSIQLDSSVVSCRLAVKFFGKGFAEIEEIEIKRKRENNFLSHTHLRQLGFDIPKKLKDVKLAVICDDFTMQCLKPECDLITFGPDDWKAQFTIKRPHALFVESAWHGNGGRWTRKVAKGNGKSNLDLFELINWCKENEIPTIFWNKEDPVHFNAFVDIAKHFDYIFTTDQNSVENYQKRANHKKVAALPFAAQPSIHNPVELYKRENGISFAGSYYAVKYLERQRDMNMLLESAAHYNLTIYDRNYGKNLIEFYFPEHLRQYTTNSLKPSEIDKAYKGYKVALNVNSVVDSPTMFSRRVFECLASNTPVVSTYSTGIKNIFKDIVFMGTTEQEFEKEFDKLLHDEAYYRRRAHQGLRNVLQHHTYENRLEYVFNQAGFDLEATSVMIHVYSLVENSSEMRRVLDMFAEQSYDYKKLTFIQTKPFAYEQLKADLEKMNAVCVTEDEFKHLSLQDKTGYVAYFDSSNFYGEHYLVDLALATKYTTSEAIGKGSYYTFENQQFTLSYADKRHVYTNELNIDACMLKSEVLREVSMNELVELFRLKGSVDFLFAKGYRLFSIDSYNFVRNLKKVPKQAKKQLHDLVNI
ncbi:glycosyltransferase [Priestia megaterium]